MMEKSEKIVYNKDDYVSKPKKVKNGSVPIDILKFEYPLNDIFHEFDVSSHSYGYNCRKFFNFCIADPGTIIFASGNLIHFLNVNTGELSFRRGSSEGIGHITKNPKLPHIAVGEIGTNPPIIIYEWPTLEIVIILTNGTYKSFSHLSYNPDGQLLVSQGGEPDYLLIIWKWKEAAILLKLESHPQTVYNMRFSHFIPSHFVTSGANHIQFWNMDHTFTGLKLKREIGRFGNIPVSDVIGVYSMPDGKVISGCKWGNILVWNKGSIEIEVKRKNKKFCHDGMITQFEFINGELMSIGMDGWVRVWYYDTIDQADLSEDNEYLEVEPIYEFEIGTKLENEDRNEKKISMLMGIKEKNPDDPEETFWYAQDGNGGLWLIDLSTDQLQQPSEKILSCHAGAVTDIANCPWGTYIASCGEGGHINIYNYLSKKLVISHHFREACRQIIWLPRSVESTGSTLICGFKNGVVRIVVININQAENLENENIEGWNKNNLVRLISAIKPHKKMITAMKINNSHEILVTGSEDSTIFCFYITSVKELPEIVPIGFISLPSGVTCMTWNHKNDNTILVGCLRGYFSEIKLPDRPQKYTKISYELVECQPKTVRFQSGKPPIDKNKKFGIDSKKRDDDHEEPPVLSKTSIPKALDNILTVNYVADNRIWLTLNGPNGFGAGVIYEFLSIDDSQAEEEIPEVKPIKVISVPEAKDKEIRSCLFLNQDDGLKYLILGMESGEIRVCRVQKGRFDTLSDYWTLQMHDNLNGGISKISLSHDRRILFTCGDDGNIFSYLVNDKNLHEETTNEPVAILKSLPNNAEDIEDDDHLSLEEVITKAEKDRIVKEAKERKENILAVLQNLGEEYREIMNRNQGLIKSQQIPLEEFELDPRITEDLNNQLKNEIDLIHKQMAFQVEKSRITLKKLMDYFIKPITHVPFAVCRIIKSNSMIYSINEKILDEEFYAAYDQIQRQINDEKLTITSSEEKVDELEEEIEEPKIQEVESFLRGLSSSTIQNKLGTKINQMLKKYRERKARSEQKAQEWKIMYANKPDSTVDDPEDIEAIENAKNTIGDYKLKVSNNFNSDMRKGETTLSKHKQLLDCRKKTHLMKEGFNEKLRNVRENKLDLQKEVTNLVEKLKSIHAEIPEKYIKPLPKIFKINFDIEFPEKNLELEKYIPMTEKIKETSREKQLSAEEPNLQITDLIDEEFEVLLLDETIIESQCKLPQFLANYPTYQTVIDVSPDLMDSLNANDRVPTPWEIEMKLARVAKKVHEQACILDYINQSYEAIDKQLDELEEERLRIQADSIYSELFQLTLQQELIILRDFETRENLLSEKVEEDLKNRLSVQQKISKLTMSMDQKTKEISRIHEKIKDLSSQFTNMASDNKFTEFLKRLYKRKFRETKISEDTSSDSSSIESTDDEDDDDDTLGDDSNDEGQNIKLLHLDESVCPAGCDEELYKATLLMRQKRHDYEAKVREYQKLVENLRRDIEKEQKKSKIVENSLNINQRELQDYVREKQKKLNSIDVTVILKLHQLQHSIEEDKVAKICDCLVFDQNQLSKLYARVGELQQETLDQKTKHEKNRNHLRRLEIDCKYMEDEIRRLKEVIKEEMFKKFGREISLTKLYEAVLRRMIYNIRADIREETKIYDKEINAVKTKYHEQVKVLENSIKENTEKLNILTLLEKEQQKFQKILKKTPESSENILKIESDYEEDLKKLEEILHHQKQQKKLFKHEIRNLRLKSRHLPPIYPQDFQRKVLHLQEDKREINKMNEFSEIHERDFYASPEIDDDTDKAEENDGILSKIINKTDDNDVFKYKMDFGTIEENTGEINWDLKIKIEELLDVLGMKIEPSLEFNIIKYLKQENGVKMAIDFIFTKLSSSNIEITTALKDYAFQMLQELKKNM